MTSKHFLKWAVILAFGAIGVAQAQTTNSWTSVGAGFWESAGNWSAGVPSNNQALVQITNDTTKAAIIRAATTNSPGSLTISNLLLSAPVGTINQLLLTTVGTNVPLRILNSFTITTRCGLDISNGAVRVEGTGVNPLKIDGEAVLHSPTARLTVTNTAGNSSILVGYAGVGVLTVSNGSLFTIKGVVAGPSSLQGTLNIAGGTNEFTTFLSMGEGGSNGTVWVTGGQLSVGTVSGVIDSTLVGAGGRGLLIVSNGNVLIDRLAVGSDSFGAGTMTVAGGRVTCSVSLNVGGAQTSTGTVWITGGELVTTNTTTVQIPPNGTARMTISNGTWLARQLRMGTGSTSSHGTLTIVGGTNIFTSFLALGHLSNHTANVWLTGPTGRLVVTNDITSIGVLGTGIMTVSNGVFLGGAVKLGTNSTGSGTLTVAGGQVSIIGPLTVGGPGTGAVLVTSGQLVITNTPATVGAGSGFIVDGSVTLTNGSSIFVRNVATVIGNRGSGSLTVFGGTLDVTNVVLGNFSSGNGTLTMGVGTLTVGGSLTVGSAAGSTGTVWLTGGPLASATARIGDSGVGQMTVSNALWSAVGVTVGNMGGSAGTLTTVGATNLLSTLTVGNLANATGTVSVTGGLLVTSNGTSFVGVTGVGQMTVSNATWLAAGVAVGQVASSAGTLTMVGVTNDWNSVNIGVGANSTGTVWMSDGQLRATSTANFVGNTGSGRLTISNGNWLAGSILVGSAAGGAGTLTIEGGNHTAYTALTLGNFACTSVGQVQLASGQLFVTNASANAKLEVRSGTFTLSGGTLIVNQLIVTNACASFIKTGGTLSATITNLSAGLDADGDGMNNIFEQANGLDPFNPNDADLDPDGDGFTNLQEFLAGTSPTNSASAFRITAITRETDDVRVTWMVGAGKAHALERTAGVAGSFSNDFAAIFSVTNGFGTTTNYLDVGAATNVPAFYYRVRLLP